MEVNLAIMVMATSILGMCCLYVFGFRENRQSVEDVASVSFADTCLAPLIQGLSATNMTWSQWCEIGDRTKGEVERVADAVWPANGWGAYLDLKDAGKSYRVASAASSTAAGVFGQVMGKVPSMYRGSGSPSVDGDFSWALVVTRSGAKIQLAFRCARRRESLLAQPVTVAEVHFQGDPDR